MAVDATFVTHHPSFETVLGPKPRTSLCLHRTDAPFFHEAGVYIQSTGEIFVTSNRYADSDGNPTISISKVGIANEEYRHEVIFPDVPMANGGVNYQDGILFCAQGHLTHPGGLIFMSLTPPYPTKTIISAFNGVPFNSLNDVVIAKDGAIWFTDPIYGFEQGFRQSPLLPAQVYRYEPGSKSVRAVADGFGRPNGIAFSPYEKVLIPISSTAMGLAIQAVRQQCASGVPLLASSEAPRLRSFARSSANYAISYAFDIVMSAGQPFLTSRRLFAFAESRAPDGIKCDVAGNVYCGCLDGISVWSPGGVLLGKILIPGGVANFCFCRAGEIMALNEHRLWKIQLADTAVGALLGSVP